ncbi:MAG: hypothetical protein FJ296_05765, partial [Planctomycetes bacterium]|nr:hypothetical protein [Planctomycetota bacterium]
MTLGAEPAHAFGGFIGPRTLLALVRSAVPYLFDGSHPRAAECPAPPPDDDGRLASLAFHPLGWWRVLLHADGRLCADAAPGPSEVADYFALCLAAHWATAASYVPTDVDAKIRGALWEDQQGEAGRATMLALVGQLRHWDLRGFSARAVDVDALAGTQGLGSVSGHDGERLAVLCGAL